WIVYGFFGIKRSPAGHRGIIVVALGLIVRNKQGPSIISRFPGLVHLVITPRSAGIQAVHTCIRAHISPIYISLLGINGYPIWISVSHGKYFRAGLRGPFREQVPFGNTVGTILVHFYPQYLTAQIVRISRRPTGIILLTSGQIVQGSITATYIFCPLFIKGRGIIPGRKV